MPGARARSRAAACKCWGGWRSAVRRTRLQRAPTTKEFQGARGAPPGAPTCSSATVQERHADCFARRPPTPQRVAQLRVSGQTAAELRDPRCPWRRAALAPREMPRVVGTAARVATQLFYFAVVSVFATTVRTLTQDQITRCPVLAFEIFQQCVCSAAVVAGARAEAAAAVAALHTLQQRPAHAAPPLLRRAWGSATPGAFRRAPQTGPAASLAPHRRRPSLRRLVRRSVAR